MKRYGEMNREELLAEVDMLEAEKRKAEFPSQTEMLERKIWMAKAYMMASESFPQGMYEVEGYSEPFELLYVNGIMAWGRMGGKNESSFPISMLKRK
ncbi:DUF1811 family protein [Paenibacillus mesophilus]|uniref:DUF1811 family protein n=1 Tax=Paenibacillus mesophilus TaxID=2582849 RepID=UPI00110ED89D|nr:DUF1811 family protein [Paenibacillus mesophilus]TMV42749.1 DUF1811 family protein [Paenibacillus mesophilus]